MLVFRRTTTQLCRDYILHAGDSIADFLERSTLLNFRHHICHDLVWNSNFPSPFGQRFGEFQRRFITRFVNHGKHSGFEPNFC